MIKITTDQIRKLRDKTGAPVIRVKKVLEEVGGDEKKAFEILQKEGFEKAAKREGRETRAGWIFTYVHHSGRSGSIVDLECETDFVARTTEFQKLGHELALQVTSMNPKDKDELLKQPYIRDETKTVGDLIKEHIAKFGENIVLVDFERFEV